MIDGSSNPSNNSEKNCKFEFWYFLFAFVYAVVTYVVLVVCNIAVDKAVVRGHSNNLFGLFLTPTPMCHLVTLARIPSPRVTWHFSFYKIQVFSGLKQLKTGNYCSIRALKCHLTHWIIPFPVSFWFAGANPLPTP